MTNDETGASMAGAVLCLFIGLVAGCCGHTAWAAGDRAVMRAEAVQRGHAEWVVDPKSGNTTWRWKETGK